MKETSLWLLGLVLGVTLAVGCEKSTATSGPDSGIGGSGGAPTSQGGGGATATGGAMATGGVSATGGMTSAGGRGGTTAEGGRGGATPVGSGGAAGSTAANPVEWHTPTVSLTATDFWIIADGQRFTSQGAAVDVHSDPGDATYTTLELTWTEQSREMRFTIYLYAPDPSGWFSNEMRTYDAQPSGDWLFYLGAFFTSPIGATFHGDLDLKNQPSDQIRGELHLHGLALSTPTLTGVCPGGGCLGSGI